MLTKSKKSFGDESILHRNCGLWIGILDTPLVQSRLPADQQAKRRRAQGRLAAHLIGRISHLHPSWQAL